ncbi:dihydroorotase [Bacillus sp. FJAT-18017]|uniref:dihydroorotase n=1 Tax=Bacillus sp. FJAT-18017 TaxID=1705566 RepID=UPI0006AFDB1B|nr:dihydroorotase [Bacillus sp. FJAT-18017]ALC91051.1 dihydroorotase [Bacillus sp. FJAT-18017]
MKLLIKDVQLYCEDKHEQKDMYIENGIIACIGKNLELQADRIIYGNGLVAAPGFIDLHVHLREPGGERKETIETGTKAAAKGGFTTIAAMPNTKPVPDTKEQMEWLQGRISETASVRVLPYVSITIGEQGEELTDFAGLKEAGAFAFTDDGVGVQSAAMMLEAMKRAAKLDMPVVAHCEEETLINQGSVHEGSFASKHGLRGIPSVCESVHIARDILLAEAAGCHYHVCHISTKESVRVVRDAKRAGIKVTAEVTPHHLLLSQDDIPGQDTNFKMNPPLRDKQDRKALIEGLQDGTIDFIATDHAPHTQDEKAKGMESAPFGITGLETAFPLLYSNYVEKGIMSLKELIDYMTIKPAQSFGLAYGRLEEGAPADIVLLDLNEIRKINPLDFLSKGKNTPFTGWTCKGWPVLTVAAGKIAYEEERVEA